MAILSYMTSSSDLFVRLFMHLLEKEAIDIFTHRVFNSHDLETSINEVYKFFRRYFPISVNLLTLRCPALP